MIASLRASSRASSARRERGDRGGADRRHRGAVEDRRRAAGLAVEQRHHALVGVEADARVGGEDARPP